jgi:hypothetical protein
MIKYLTHSEIDIAKWDLCIEQSVNSLVYGYSWYLNKLAPGWCALVLNDYEAVMPLTGNKKLFINYLYQPFFTQQLGVFYKNMSVQSRPQDFLDAIPAKYKFADINLNDRNEIENGKYHIKKRKNFVLDLNYPYEKLYKGFDEHCTRNIKKSKKHNQSVRPLDPAVAVAFYQKYKALNTSAVLPKDYENFLEVLLTAETKQLLLCRGVYSDKNELTAVGVFLIHKDRIIYLLGGASEVGRELRSMFFLFDDLILEQSNKPLELDFEGSEIPGIARFFKGFGAEKRPYYKLYLNRLPWPFSWLK